MTRAVLVAGIAAALAVCLGACGALGLGSTSTPPPSLAASQAEWCSRHDMTPLIVIGATRAFEGNEVLEAGQALGVPVPQVILDADTFFTLSNVSPGLGKAMSDKAGDGFIDGWPDALAQWRTTPDYARACIAALEGR